MIYFYVVPSFKKKWRSSQYFIRYIGGRFQNGITNILKMVLRPLIYLVYLVLSYILHCLSSIAKVHRITYTISIYHHQKFVLVLEKKSAVSSSQVQFECNHAFAPTSITGTKEWWWTVKKRAEQSDQSLGWWTVLMNMFSSP